MSTVSEIPLLLKPATDADFEFTHDLTRANMEDYVKRHWGGWSREIYTENYHKGRNLIVWEADTRVGYVRVLPQPPVLVLDDLQIIAARQRRGFGTYVIEYLYGALSWFECTHLRLRVFHENPARRLYLRAGFREVQRSGDTSILERGAAVEAPVVSAGPAV